MSVTDATIALFLENAAKSAAVVHRAAGAAKLRSILSEIVAQDADVFCPCVTELEQAAAAGGVRLVPGYASARVTVEEVSAAIAETGSIVCTSSGGKAVQASLLPAHHVALVPRDRIFATLDDYFAGQAAAPPTNLTIITGPSRTADIELNLVIGVHGPERLDIIVV
ncbi:MAG TPA: lactate utilization protein [Dongiaceae bacterium]|nr:lactate utilization protein [Dongiaceae bacterium]